MGSIDFDRYWSLEEVYDYMDQLEAEFPDIAKGANRITKM